MIYSCLGLLFDFAIVESNYDSLVDQNKKLELKYQKTVADKVRLEKENRILKANISSLYKTAASEIQRKDSQMADLRGQLDDLILRRHRSSQGSHSSSSSSSHKRTHEMTYP